MILLPTSKRTSCYLILPALSLVMPYVVTMACILLTGDRYEGMHLAVIPGIVLVHSTFGFIYTQEKIVLKLLLVITTTALAFGMVWMAMSHDIIHTNWDLYQFWDLALTNFLSGLILFEMYYQIRMRLID